MAIAAAKTAVTTFPKRPLTTATHGTATKNVAKILKEGIKGPAYVTADPILAAQYAGANGSVLVLNLKGLPPAATDEAFTTQFYPTGIPADRITAIIPADQAKTLLTRPDIKEAFQTQKMTEAKIGVGWLALLGIACAASAISRKPPTAEAHPTPPKSDVVPPK